MNHRNHLFEQAYLVTNPADREMFKWALARISKLEAALIEIVDYTRVFGKKFELNRVNEMARDSLKEDE